MEPEVPAKRSLWCGDRQQHCRAAIVHWRAKCWNDNYAGSTWGVTSLISDDIVMKVATWAHIMTIQSLMLKIPEWLFAEWHGAEVLVVVALANREWERRKENGSQMKPNWPLNTTAGPAPSQATLQPMPIPQPNSPTMPTTNPSMPPSLAYPIPMQPFTYPTALYPMPMGMHPPPLIFYPPGIVLYYPPMMPMYYPHPPHP